MKQNPIDQGRFTENAHGLGTVTKEMVRQRAEELALANGRSRQHVLESDLEEAYQELTGKQGLNPTPTPEEQIPEENRWSPVAGSVGHKAEAVPAPDEQTFAEHLVNEGTEDAELDQMRKAAAEGPGGEQT